MTNDQTPEPAPKFDFDAYPPDTLFHDRRTGPDRRHEPTPPAAPAAPERRARVERRRRVDPTTFEKQYSDDEVEFMNAMHRYKVQSGKTFPSYGEVLRVARGLGYRKASDAFLEIEDLACPSPSDSPIWPLTATL